MYKNSWHQCDSSISESSTYSGTLHYTAHKTERLKRESVCINKKKKKETKKEDEKMKPSFSVIPNALVYMCIYNFETPYNFIDILSLSRFCKAYSESMPLHDLLQFLFFAVEIFVALLLLLGFCFYILLYGN